MYKCFICIYVCVPTTCVSGALGGQKRASGTGVTDAVSHLVGAGNWTQEKQSLLWITKPSFQLPAASLFLMTKQLLKISEE